MRCLQALSYKWVCCSWVRSKQSEHVQRNLMKFMKKKIVICEDIGEHFFLHQMRWFFCYSSSNQTNNLVLWSPVKCLSFFTSHESQECGGHHLSDRWGSLPLLRCRFAGCIPLFDCFLVFGVLWIYAKRILWTALAIGSKQMRGP